MARLLFTGLWLASQVLAFDAPAPVIKAVTTTGAGYSACVSAESYIASCSSAIPNIANAPATSIARCLCCSNAVYAPSVWDGVAATCASYIRTALPASTSEYSAFSALASFCVIEGNVCGGGGAATVATSSSSRATASAVVTTTTASTSRPSSSSSPSSTSRATSTSAQTGQSLGGTTSRPTSTASTGTTTTSRPATSTVTVAAASTSRAAAPTLNGKDSLAFGVLAPIVAMFVL